jgi:ribonuclease P/MRP protein subunit POP3
LDQAETEKQIKSPQAVSSPPDHLSTIFLTHPSPSTHVPYTPLPLLAHLSSSHHPALPPTRLIPLSVTSESKLCKALGISRVGIIGVFDEAPGAAALMDYVREKVEVTDVPWARQVAKGEWLGTKVMFGEEDVKT